MFTHKIFSLLSLDLYDFYLIDKYRSNSDFICFLSKVIRLLSKCLNTCWALTADGEIIIFIDTNLKSKVFETVKNI